MGTEENKTIVSKMLEEVYNKQNPDAIAKYYTADLVNHDPNLPQFRDLNGFKQLVRQTVEEENDVGHNQRLAFCRRDRR
ncbi:MAG: nuclear transport factor 2 family protein [Syntrophobacteraceae bacterium]